MRLGIWLAAAAWVAIGSAASAQAYRPSFHPDQLKGPPAGDLNEVLVLGSPHLSSLPDSFRPELLEPLLARLEAWRPTAVAIENLSGLQCDAMRRYPSRYAESVATYCYDPSAEGQALGLDVPAANAEAERLLAEWPAAPTAAQRRRLAALFLAAGEPSSALVQWLRLPEGERKAQDGLTADMAAKLNRRMTRKNESDLLAAVLAARLGQERLWAVDDHTADSASRPEEEAAQAKAIMAAWDNPYVQARKDMDQPLFENLAQADGLLNIYRAYNTPETQMLAYRSDFGATHVEPSPEAFGRRYLGYWETRNLRMVANMRDVLGRYPGTRMLTIVGASHKGYYEAYLDQMHDVRLVSSDEVLR
ncbi:MULTISPECIES: DUF5694 domain-containing protein [Brevundimonas]|uniref:DUF5694 domain-containing protein n=1 Tax=Brevundimonas TaxID=41275 RepID=UPI0019072BC7|nr:MULTISPECIES: DUF5694 domain-containing protein [Brevundimonas]MBK1968630.1 hypothetical protein [Brevundimonas diminuta]MBK1974134.1 hypothetical protein [Brevundimonas diminuta]MDA0744308.1 DUF5694 domain-containing protein [Pseudomonadota bacterium]MDM8354503.1 DUF5694 domain-containing protein [Brevundimonas diminuta]